MNKCGSTHECDAGEIVCNAMVVFSINEEVTLMTKAIFYNHTAGESHTMDQQTALRKISGGGRGPVPEENQLFVDPSAGRDRNGGLAAKTASAHNIFQPGMLGFSSFRGTVLVATPSHLLAFATGRHEGGDVSARNILVRTSTRGGRR